MAVHFTYDEHGNVTSVGLSEAKLLMDTPDAVLKYDVDYYSGKRVLDQLIAAGAKAKMVIAKEN